MHEHSHSEAQNHYSPQESQAMLAYMIGHNRHHTEELHELAHSIGGDAASLIHDAMVDFQMANEKLTEALQILKGE